MHLPAALDMVSFIGNNRLFGCFAGDVSLHHVRRLKRSKASIWKIMSKELEKVTAMIREQIAHLPENTRIELLDALACGASEEAGHLTFDSPDAVTYED